MFYNTDGGFQSVGYTPEGRVLTLDNHVRLAGWDVAGGRPERLLALDKLRLERWAMLKGLRSPAGHIGILTESGLRRIDLNDRQYLPVVTPDQGRIAEVSEDGTLAVVNESGVLRWRLWDLESGAATDDHFDLLSESTNWFRYNPVLSPDNRVFAMSVVLDGRVLAWEHGNPKPRTITRAGRGRHYPFLAFGPDSRFLVGAQTTRFGQVTVWNLPDGKPRWSIRQEMFIWAIAVHPSGKLLAVATVGGVAGRVVRFLDAESGAELTRFNWQAGRIRCLAFSPDGLTCAAGCSDRRLVVWDVDE